MGSTRVNVMWSHRLRHPMDGSLASVEVLELRHYAQLIYGVSCDDDIYPNLKLASLFTLSDDSSEKLSACI